jgi:hypothetical protein
MSHSQRTVLAMCIAAVPLLIYPLVVLAGGGASFPTYDRSCGQIAAPGATEGLELVYGRFDTSAAAEQLRDDVVRVGFVGTEVRRDDCGQWKVVYDGIDDYATGESVIEEARGAGFRAHLEVVPG